MLRLGAPCLTLAAQSSITREQFEELAADFFDRAAAPLRRLLERNAVKLEDVDAVRCGTCSMHGLMCLLPGQPVIRALSPRRAP